MKILNELKQMPKGSEEMLLRVGADKSLSLQKEKQKSKENNNYFNYRNLDRLETIRVFIPSSLCGNDSSKCDVYLCYKYCDTDKNYVSDGMFLTGNKNADFYIAETILSLDTLHSNSFNISGEVIFWIQIDSIVTSTIKIKIPPKKDPSKSEFEELESELIEIENECKHYAKEAKQYANRCLKAVKLLVDSVKKSDN